MKIFLVSAITVLYCFHVLGQESNQKSVNEIYLTVSEIVNAEPLDEGMPKLSDVCFSPRWPKERPGGMPLEVAPQFHTTRLEWVYLNENSEYFVTKANQKGYSVSGTVNSSLPDISESTELTYLMGRALDLDGNFVTLPWHLDHHNNSGCINNPDYKEIWMYNAKIQIDAGAENLQMDDPGTNINYLGNEGCFCEYCVSGFSDYLNNLTVLELNDLGISDPLSFDYKAYRNQLKEDTEFAQEQKDISPLFFQYFENFQRQSVYNFYDDVHGQLNNYAGREIIYSCNGSKGYVDFLHNTHQLGIFEIYPDREGRPGYLYEEMILPMRELGKPFIGTLVSKDIAMTRRLIGQMYAFGKWLIVPWDVYNKSQPRVFATPEDCADLYGFVRANENRLDNYWEAAVVGRDLNDTRYDEIPPVHLLGGSGLVRGVVRAKQGESDAPVVIHLVDWATDPEPFRVVLDPRRFFGDSPIRVTLSVPFDYDKSVHEAAYESNDYSELSIDEVLVEGSFTNINIPKLSPWGILTIEPFTESESQVWQPMIHIEPESYYSRNLAIYLDLPYEGPTIRYTLDGSEPTEESLLYESPVSIKESTIIRARAFDEIGNKSPIAEALFNYLGEDSLLPDSEILASNLVMWVRADALQLQDGEPVFEWSSSAGPSPELKYVKLSNNNTSEPPVFRENVINGMPVVSFEHANHSLGIKDFANDYLAGKQFAIFMVSRSNDNNFGFSGNSLRGSGGDPRLYITRGSLHYDILRPILVDAPAGETSINTYGYDGTTLQTWLNGEAGETRSQAEPLTLFGNGGHFSVPFWANNEPHLGEMAEIIIYDRSINDDERRDIESYLANKYSLQTIQKWTAAPYSTSTSLDPVQSSIQEPVFIYPNPCKGDLLNIALPEHLGDEIYLKILDFNGAELLSRKIENHRDDFQFYFDQKLLPGVYFLNLIDENRNYVQKIVVN